MSKPPKVNYCPEALDIAAEIEASEYDNDPNIAADITVVRTICTFAPETPDPDVGSTATSEPLTEEIPTATPAQ